MPASLAADSHDVVCVYFGSRAALDWPRGRLGNAENAWRRRFQRHARRYRLWHFSDTRLLQRHRVVHRSAPRSVATRTVARSGAVIAVAWGKAPRSLARPAAGPHV